MTVADIAQEWLAKVEDTSLHAQLSDLVEQGSNEDIEDAFFQDLSFGTAGLRGIIGPGTNRMNIYTVGRATQGLADYILATHTGSKTPCVAIARDSRHMGEQFVRHAASVLAANGIRAYLYPRIEPTPALSFAVRDLHCDAGICMTASHNPASYNGYKVYGSDGCQITSEAACLISASIANTDLFSSVKTVDFEESVENGMVEWIDESTLNRYLDAVLENKIETARGAEDDLSVVYTPLCGTGLECMERVFNAIGLEEVSLVASQAQPDGDFPTCTYPNPEERAALEEGIATCKQKDADLLLATDPDADRVGIAVKHAGDYTLLTGNEVGILLFDFLCTTRAQEDTMPQNPIVVSTIVSTAMIDDIAEQYGVEVRRTLTGFKYIGDIITSLEQASQQDRFLFGFEESYGYLAGCHVRDKDAIVTCMLICQMARAYKAQGYDLVDRIEQLYDIHGYHANRTINIAFPGAQGAQAMQDLMEGLRSASPVSMANRCVQENIDYSGGVHGLPAADVFEQRLEDGSKIIFRPSGTEPKVKVYLFAKGQSRKDAANILDELEEAARAIVGL